MKIIFLCKPCRDVCVIQIQINATKHTVKEDIDDKDWFFFFFLLFFFFFFFFFFFSSIQTVTICLEKPESEVQIALRQICVIFRMCGGILNSICV